MNSKVGMTGENFGIRSNILFRLKLFSIGKSMRSDKGPIVGTCFPNT